MFLAAVGTCAAVILLSGVGRTTAVAEQMLGTYAEFLRAARAAGAAEDDGLGLPPAS